MDPNAPVAQGEPAAARFAFSARMARALLDMNQWLGFLAIAGFVVAGLSLVLAILSLVLAWGPGGFVPLPAAVAFLDGAFAAGALWLALIVWRSARVLRELARNPADWLFETFLEQQSAFFRTAGVVTLGVLFVVPPVAVAFGDTLLDEARAYFDRVVERVAERKAIPEPVVLAPPPAPVCPAPIPREPTERLGFADLERECFSRTDNLCLLNDPGGEPVPGGTRLNVNDVNIRESHLHPAGLQADVTSEEGQWRISFGPPSGEALTARLYDNAIEDVPKDSKRPWLRVERRGENCTGQRGKFRVLEYEYDPETRSMNRLVVDFERQCYYHTERPLAGRLVVTDWALSYPSKKPTGG
ncbi:MAG TPA: hypothetical protein VF789_03200 [Thermoanaerobaculia bacterium]